MLCIEQNDEWLVGRALPLGRVDLSRPRGTRRSHRQGDQGGGARAPSGLSRQRLHRRAERKLLHHVPGLDSAPEHDHCPRPPLILDRDGRLADTACWRHCHASIKSRQTSPTGDERQNKRKSGPSPADSLKESQLAAGRDPLHRVGRHRRAGIRTASLQAVVRLRMVRLQRCRRIVRCEKWPG